MHAFSDPVEFEDTLINIADGVLSGDFVIHHHLSLGSAGRITELDYLFQPRAGSSENVLYIFEFKYSPSPTLADSEAFTQRAKFKTLAEANPTRKLNVFLVTNGKVPDAVRRALSPISVIDQIQTADIWREAITAWTRRELSSAFHYQ